MGTPRCLCGTPPHVPGAAQAARSGGLTAPRLMCLCKAVAHSLGLLGRSVCPLHSQVAISALDVAFFFALRRDERRLAGSDAQLDGAYWASPRARSSPAIAICAHRPLWAALGSRNLTDLVVPVPAPTAVRGWYIRRPLRPRPRPYSSPGLVQGVSCCVVCPHGAPP